MSEEKVIEMKPDEDGVYKATSVSEKETKSEQVKSKPSSKSNTVIRKRRVVKKRQAPRLNPLEQVEFGFSAGIGLINGILHKIDELADTLDFDDNFDDEEYEEYEDDCWYDE